MTKLVVRLNELKKENHPNGWFFVQLLTKIFKQILELFS